MGTKLVVSTAALALVAAVWFLWTRSGDEAEHGARDPARAAEPIDRNLLDVPRTHLAGTLRVPEGLALADARLRLERLDGVEEDYTIRLDAMSFMRGERDTLHWDAGSVRTGVYLATIHPYQHRSVIEAEVEGGETRVALELPPLVTVQVQVVDAATGETLEPERLQWCDGPLEGVGGFTMTPIAPSPIFEGFQFVAPEGPVEVFATRTGHVEASQKLVLRAPEARVRLELARTTGVRLVVREGEAALPVGLEFWSQVRVEDGVGERVFARSGGNAAAFTLHLPGAGRYELRFPALEGYLRFEPITIEVAAGELLEQTVPAERMP